MSEISVKFLVCGGVMFRKIP